jgi:hypothetical protein
LNRRFHLNQAAHLDQCLSASRSRPGSFPYFFLDEPVEVLAEFFVQIAIQTLLPEERFPKALEHASQDHESPLLLGKHLSHRRCDSRPFFLLSGKLPFSGTREAVKLGAASGRRKRPFTVNESLLLEPMKSRKKRSRLHDEGSVRYLFDALRDAQAVTWLKLDRAKNEKIQRALE